jgi:1,2-phenylacetyl-CoA epoxidase PaaB subunit
MPTQSGENTAGTTETTAPAKQRRNALNESHVWQVYARRKYEEPLHEIGNVMADDVELAQVYARTIFDEFSWVEMVIVPRETIVTVIAS